MTPRLQPQQLLYKPKTLQNLQAHVYIHPWGSGLVRVPDNMAPEVRQVLLGVKEAYIGSGINNDSLSLSRLITGEVEDGLTVDVVEVK